MANPQQISSSFVVLGPEFSADTLPVSDDFYARLEKAYGDFAGYALISCHGFETDWPTWESHPKGDEFVVLLAGAAEMVLAQEGGDNSVHLNEPGEFVIVPRGVWHTAKVSKFARMLFVTPGEGTENLEQPPGRGN